MSDIFGTAWGSITGTNFKPGDTVAIYGAGPVGMLAAYSALLRGASKVYSIDYVESRLALAESIGAIAIDLRKGNPSEQITKLEPGGINRVCDCVGYECVNTKLQPQENYIINDALKLVANGGGIYVTGVYWAGPPDKGEPNLTPKLGTIAFDVGTWWIKNVTINGGGVTVEDQEPALRNLIESGRAKPGFVFDKIIDIDQAPEAYRLFSEKKVEKVAIRFFP